MGTADRTAEEHAPLVVSGWVDLLARRADLRSAALVLLCLVAFLPGFFSIPPVDRDEARFAQATSQMFETGDFINIRFQDDPRHKKLIGIYWLQAASVSVFGAETLDNIWAYRIPSLIGATLAVLLTAWAGARLFNPTVGLFAGVMMVGCVILGVEARLAKTDAALLATILAAQFALARIYLSRDDDVGWAAPITFWLAAGVGVLIKGPVLPLVCGGTLLWLIVTERRIFWLKRLRFLVGVPLALAVVLPWLVAITVMTDGAFLQASFGHDMFGKISTGQESHGAPPGLYLAMFWVTFWPFCVLAGLAIPWVWRHRATPVVRFCLGWIIPTWIVFELSVTKLPHYTLPTYPAIALLTAAAMYDRFGWTKRPSWLTLWPMLPWAIVALALPVAVAAIPYLLLSDVLIIVRIAVLAALPLAFLMAMAIRRLAFDRALACGLAAALLAYVMAYGFTFPNLTGLWLSPRLAEAIEQQSPCPDPKVAASGTHEPSLVFLVGTDIELTDAEGVARFLADGPCRVGIVEQPDLELFSAALEQRGAEATILAELNGTALNGADRLHLFVYAGPDDGQR
ncbi:MAG: ArnT family glycosyltransferase [Geminicoccaceae bacterium]